MSTAGEGFDPEYFSRLVALESGHYWFENRNRLITWALARHFPAARSFHELGCGTGFVLSAVARAFPSWSLSASEAFPEGVAQARRRVPRACLEELDARRLPAEPAHDVIGAFDVLEHVPEHELVLARMAAALEPGGGIVLTVPQHPWLWSDFDEFSHHVRRYRRRELVELVRRAGLRVELVSSFVSLLLPLLVLARLGRRGTSADAGMRQLRVGRLTNALLALVLAGERLLIRAGLRFPAGGSLLLVARKA